MGNQVEHQCRACAMKIIFAEGPAGRPIPLQKVRNVYAVKDGHATVVQTGELWISHFEGCTVPQRFSKKR
jgi:hypothetical protein